LGPAWRLLAGLLLVGGLLSGPARAEGTELDCLIQPERTVLVSAPVEAIVTSVWVERGEIVEEDQIVAMLEASVEEAAVATARARAENTAAVQGAKARLEFEEKRLERSRELFRQGVISDTELDELESAEIIARADWLRSQEDKALAELQLRTAQASLKLRTVRSPLKGVVVDRILAPGEFADPPQLLELAQIDPLRVEVYAPVSLLGSIEVGMMGRVRPEEPVGGVYEAEVTVVDRVVDAASGTFGIRLALPNPDYALPAGLRCRVEFGVSSPVAAESPPVEVDPAPPISPPMPPVGQGGQGG
jgi:RND family efflux transporter MFP subunit